MSQTIASTDEHDHLQNVRDRGVQVLGRLRQPFHLFTSTERHTAVPIGFGIVNLLNNAEVL